MSAKSTIDSTVMYGRCACIQHGVCVPLEYRATHVPTFDLSTIELSGPLRSAVDGISIKFRIQTQCVSVHSAF